MQAASRAVAVFCGSKFGHDPAHAEAARALGAGLAAAGITLVYGGGSVGLMGAIAAAALGAGGRVIGVIPEFLTRLERPCPALTELEIVPSMHVRKRRMFELADAFVTLPGGLGTLDETIEILTWRQLGLHDRRLIVVDVAGWARPLVALIESLIGAGFVSPDHRRLFEVVPDVAGALAALAAVPDHPPASLPRL
jgi:uncharacterized protein (TIGR00730 family)